MSSSKKHHSNRSLLSFDCLPPRVIIHEILEYYLLWIPFNSSKGVLKPYSLFGYFKKDRLRNLWFVFSSLYLRENFITSFWIKKDDESEVYLDLRRITFLRFDSPISPYETHDFKYERFLRFLKKLTTVKPGKTNRMRVLKLHDLTKDSPNILQNDLTFPYLTKLSYSNLVEDFDSKEYPFLKNWNNLDWSKFSHFRSLELELDYRKVIHSLDFLSNNLPLSNMLTSLILRRISLKQPLEAKFPKLEKLEISECENIVIDITPGDCLIDLCYKDYDGHSTTTLKKILLCRPTKLNSISFMFGRSNFESYGQMIETHFDTEHFAKSLQKLSLFIPSSHITIQSAIVENISSSLKEIRINRLCDLNKNFFETWKFPQLSRLDYSFGKIGTLICSFSETLKVLEFHTVSDLSDDFFSKNQWNNLESLKLGNCNSIEGQKDWGQMKKLRSLEIRHCVNFVDNFFQKDGNIHKNMPCLEKLGLVCYFNNNLEGKDWNLNSRFENLKILSIEYSELIGDELFEGNLEFSKLEELSLISIENIHGTDWKIDKMENLRMFVLEDCPMNKNKDVLERIYKERGVIVENEKKEFLNL